MTRIRVAAANLNQNALDWAGNTERIIRAIKIAKETKVGILGLPELCISGYGCDDAFLNLSTIKKSFQALREIQPHTGGITVAVGLPVYFRGRLFNCGALVQNGKLIGIHAKRSLAREGIHYEPRWFSAWPEGKVNQILVNGESIPMGDLNFQLGDIGVTMEICEEAWGLQPASAPHAHRTDIILNMSASHFSFDKDSVRKQLVANASRSLGVCYVYANLVGLECGRVIYDGGSMIARAGYIVARAPRLSMQDVEITTSDININQIRMEKVQNQSIQSSTQLMTENFSPLVVSAQSPTLLETYEAGNALKAMESSLSDNVDFFRSVTLGLYDYLRKSGAKGFVVSLSGGCDSAATVTLVTHMFARVLLEVPKDRLEKDLPFMRTDLSFVEQGLTTIYQATKNSGDVTRSAAKKIAEAIGSKHHEVEIQEVVDQYEKIFSQATGTELTWDNFDLTKQNIQARTRAPLAWLFANAESKLLLTTANRSEIALGYVTMDGDTAGGLAPIAGVDKQFLREWLKWAETECALGVGPIEALSAINNQPPTAELRPSDSKQTDEDDLMPYEVIARIEDLLIRDRFDTEAVVEELKVEFPEYRDDIAKFVKKFTSLWYKNQWKRERLAPSFHLDRFNLDPKSWARFPILSKPT